MVPSILRLTGLGIGKEKVEHVLIPAIVDERSQRIIDTAISLADRDGYAAVRLRDVAEQADVALGTVYRRFRSKEDILVAALEQEALLLRNALDAKPPNGETPRERARQFFELLTRGLLRRPNLGRALVRSVASAEPEITEKVLRFHEVVTEPLVTALDGGDGSLGDDVGAIATVAILLQQVWFASLVGWACDMHDEEMILAQVDTATALMLTGLERI